MNLNQCYKAKAKMCL